VYVLKDVVLNVEPDEMEIRAGLASLWSSLSIAKANGIPGNFMHRITLHLQSGYASVPATTRCLFQAGGFSALQNADSFYLTDHSSVFRLKSDSGKGEVYLAPSFFNKPRTVQYNFWTFVLLKLLRPLNFYSLHAAGLVMPSGPGVLVAGPSGSGKSTLALGLIRRGWQYLSDDAVLLHPSSGSIAALALRENFYVDASVGPENSDLTLGSVVPDNDGGQRQEVQLRNTILGLQHTAECIPSLLLFSRIVPEEHSDLIPIDHATALKQLLEASGPQLFDHETMRQHLALLKRLLRQTRSFDLKAGRDLHRNPETLVRLLSDMDARREAWRVS
jgi:hypothetical protein